jgi:GTP-binding protein
MGTIFKDLNDDVIFEITDNEPMFVAARGGVGGKGNHYYLSNENRRPTQFETGHVGESFNFLLELKLIADAALVNT